MPKVILIDIDDTILSFQGYVREAMKSGFDEFGIGPFEEEMLSVFHQVNSRLWHRLEEGDLSFEELKKIRWNLVFDALGIQADGVKFEEYFRSCLFNSAIPVDGAMELLSHLKEKYVLCAASNGPYLQQINRLKVGGMHDFFSHFFISEEIGHSKPSNEYFAVCMERLNQGIEKKILPKDVAIVGDSLTSDIAGGKNAGMQTIFYNAKQQEIPQDLRPDFTVTSLKEICDIL